MDEYLDLVKGMKKLEHEGDSWRTWKSDLKNYWLEEEWKPSSP